jgi:hypothetical protein
MINDDDALFLLDRVETEQDPAEKSHMIGLLSEYEGAKQKAGLKPFQPSPEAVAKRTADVDRLYSAGLDKLDSVLPPEQLAALNSATATSLNPLEAKARAINSSVLADSFQNVPPEVLDANWPTYRKLYAKQVLGIDKPAVSETELFAGIAKQREQAAGERTMMAELINRMAVDAASGNRPFLEAWKKEAGGISANPAWQPMNHDKYRNIARQAYDAISKENEPIRPVIDAGQKYFYQATNGIPTAEENKDAFISLLQTLPRADQEKALALASVAVKEMTPRVTSKEGRANFIQKEAVALGRGVQAMGSNIESAAKHTGLMAMETIGQLKTGTGFGRESDFRVLDDIDQRRERLRLERRVDEALKGQVDPVASSNAIVNGLYGFTESVPYMATVLIPYVGIPLTAAAMGDQARAELEDNGVSPASSMILGTGVGIVNAGIEHMQAGLTFTGKLAGFEKWLKVPVTTKAQLLTKLGYTAAIHTAQENAEEFSQNITRPLAQAFGSMVSDSVPNVDWKAEWKGITDGAPQTFFALLPATLVGAGVASFKDAAYGKQYLENKKTLTALGFTEAQIEAITQAPTIEAQEAIFKEEYKRREMNTAAQQNAFDELDSEMKGITVEQQDMQHGGARAERQDDGSWAVHDSKGELVDVTTTPESALALVREVNQGETQTLDQSVEEMISFFNERSPEGSTIERVAERRSLIDKVAAGEIDLEEAQRAVDLANQLNQFSEPLTVDTAQIHGENVGKFDRRAGVFRDVSKIFDGASPLTVVEEKSEGYLKRQIAAGVVTLEDVQAWRQSVDGEQTDNSERALTEWFSSTAKAYMVGNVDHESIPSSFRAFLRAMQQYLGQVMGLARKLTEMKDAGTLDADLKQHLARAVGLDENFVAEEGRKAEREAAQGRGEALSEWIKGRLPNAAAAKLAGDPFAGELADLGDGMKNKQTAQAFFARGTAAISLDDVAQAAREAGFAIDTPGELLSAVRDSLKGIETHAEMAGLAEDAVRLPSFSLGHSSESLHPEVREAKAKTIALQEQLARLEALRDAEPEKYQRDWEKAYKKLLAAEAHLFQVQQTHGSVTDMNTEPAHEWARRVRAADVAAMLDSSTRDKKNAAKSFAAQVWKAFAAHDKIFQYKRTGSGDAQVIAKTVSDPLRPVTAVTAGGTVEFRVGDGALVIHDAHTSRPYVRWIGKDSSGIEDGGGAQAYVAALDWIHNNGKQIRDDPGGLSAINAIRRTSNFFASALRWGTTEHLEPHKDQGVLWTSSDTLNTAALAAKEMENVFKAIDQASGWVYDFQNGSFRDSDGEEVRIDRATDAVRLGNPRISGVGISTLQRGIITRSALQEYERGRTQAEILGLARPGLIPEGITYSLGSGEFERVMKERRVTQRIAADEQSYGENFSDNLKASVAGNEYEVLTDVDAVAQAQAEFAAKGAQQMLQEFMSDVDSGKGKVDMIVGMSLVRSLDNAGKIKDAQQVALRLAELGTKAGQTIQAFSLLGLTLDTKEKALIRVATETAHKVEKIKQGAPAIDAAKEEIGKLVEGKAYAMLKDWIDEITGFAGKKRVERTLPRVADLAEIDFTTFALAPQIRAAGIIPTVAKMLQESGAVATELALIEKYGEKIKPHLRDIFLEAAKKIVQRKTPPTARKGERVRKEKAQTTLDPKLSAEKAALATPAAYGGDWYNHNIVWSLPVEQKTLPLGDSEERAPTPKDVDQLFREIRAKAAQSEVQMPLDVVEDHLAGRKVATPEQVEATLDEARGAGILEHQQTEFDGMDDYRKRLEDAVFDALKERNVVVPRPVRKAVETVMSSSHLGEKTWLKHFRSAFSEQFDVHQMNEAQVARLGELAANIKSTPENSGARYLAVMDMNSFIADHVKPYDWIDTAFSLWYASALAGLTTTARNLLGNTQALMANVGIAQLMQNPANWLRSWSQVGPALRSAMQLASAEAGPELKRGEGVRVGQIEAGDPVKGRRSALDTAKLWAPWKASRYVGRFLSVQDMFFSATASELKSRQIAMQLAMEAAESGRISEAQIGPEIERLLQSSSDQIRGLEARAAKEWAMLSPELQAKQTQESWQNRRVQELRVLEREGELVERATFAGQRATFNYDPEGAVGVLLGTFDSVFKQIGKLSETAPTAAGRKTAKFVAQFGKTSFIPFFRVPANIFNQALNYTPAGFARLLINKQIGVMVASGGRVSLRPVTVDEVADMKHKAVLGTAALAALWAYARPAPDDEKDGPWIQVHGHGSGNTARDMARNGPQWKPWSIEVRTKKGKVFIDYKLTPFAPGLAAVGFLHDKERYDKTGSTPALGWALGQGVAAIMLAQSPMQGLSDLASTASIDQMKSEASISRLLARSVAGYATNMAIPLANFWRSIDRAFVLDNKKESGDVASAMLAQVPFADNFARDRLDVLGDSMENRPLDWLAQAQASGTPEARIYSLFGAKKIQPSDLYPYRHHMTPEQFYDFTKARGQALKDMLLGSGEELLHRMQALEPKEAAKVMHRLNLRATKVAKVAVHYTGKELEEP